MCSEVSCNLGSVDGSMMLIRRGGSHYRSDDQRWLWTFKTSAEQNTLDGFQRWGSKTIMNRYTNIVEIMSINEGFPRPLYILHYEFNKLLQWIQISRFGDL